MNAFVGILLIMTSANQDPGFLKNLIPCPKYMRLAADRIHEFSLDGVQEFHPSVMPPDSFCSQTAYPRVRVCFWNELTTEEQFLFPEEAQRLRDNPEAYAILLRAQNGWIVACSQRGLQYGLATLRQVCILAEDAGMGLPEMTIVDWPDTPVRGAHVCYHLIREWMPYSAPDFHELIRTLERFAQLKLNTVLLELEAMFPFQQHPDIACACAFTPEEIHEIVRTCDSLHIELIPLVQCLGHQYYILTHERYAEYRETPDKIQQLCPTSPRSAELVLELVDEYRSQMPNLRYFHLGGDEARQLGDCARCREKIDQEGISALYVDYVAKVCEGVRRRGITPMIWSDMLEHHPECLDGISKETIIAYWNYDFKTWPREYALPQFVNAGYPTMAFPGIRFGKSVAYATVNYPVALPGIADLTRSALRDGGKGIITTNWMKGIPIDLCWRGYAYAAWEPWTAGRNQKEFDRAFTALWYGLDGPLGEALGRAYDNLAVFVPYAEDSGLRLYDRLQRFDLSGLPLAKRIDDYTSPSNREETLRKLDQADKNVTQARMDLDLVRSHFCRNEREWQLLDLGARTLDHKIRMGRVFDRIAAWTRGEIVLDMETRSAWRDEVDKLKTEWAVLREETREILAKTNHPLCAASMADTKFEKDAFTALEMYQRLLMEAERIEGGEK
ncbi:MAG: family 20 glycosylhydrolase [bacterium]